MKPAPPEEVSRKLSEVLQRSEFADLDEKGGAEVQAIAELITRLMQTVDALIGDLRTNHPGLFVAILVVGSIVLGFAIWMGARGAARRSYAEGHLPDEVPQVLEGDPKRLRAEAREHAAAGRYLEAVRLAFRASIIDQALREGSLESLAQAGRFRRAHTYRELVEEFARSSDALALMRRISERIESGLYADGEITAEDWAEAERLP